MALNANAIGLLRPYIKGDVLSLGYPNLLLDRFGCEKVFGFTPATVIDPPSTIKLIERHKGKKLAETRGVFAQLGAVLTCVDAVAHDGVDRIADLNYPQALGEYDLVIDAGTIEHCFNIGQALINAANAVKIGGVILHTPPMTMVNHGFYNLCPTLFPHFYLANGFEMLFMAARGGRGEGGGVPIKENSNFDAEPGCALYVLAQRRERVPLVMPIQGKYMR